MGIISGVAVTSLGPRLLQVSRGFDRVSLLNRHHYRYQGQGSFRSVHPLGPPLDAAEAAGRTEADESAKRETAMLPGLRHEGPDGAKVLLDEL